METKYRRFTITTDKEYSGFGYGKLKDDMMYLHCFTLFMFIATWTTPVKTGKRQTAKQISNTCAEIDGKWYDLKYYGDVNNLLHVYYRNSLGNWIKTTTHYKYNSTHYVISSPEHTESKIVPAYNISTFNPNLKLEGYVKGNTFYAVKELSVG